MYTDRAPHLRHAVDQMASVLFYMLNAPRIMEGQMLFHKNPGRATFDALDLTEDQWHLTIQSLFRQIEQQIEVVRPAPFREPLEGLTLLYRRFRTEYVLDNPQRNQQLVEQPAPNRKAVPIMPVRQDYGSNYDGFYSAFFVETLAQIDAYRWMCQLDPFAHRGGEIDLPQPFEDTKASYTGGWPAIEPIANDLMRTFLANLSTRHGVRDQLASYGTQVALRDLCQLGNRMEDWIKEGVEARRKARS